jgi:hypothetical protein
MEKETRYLVYQPNTTLHRLFKSYQVAWEFSERHFRNGCVICLIEQVTHKS